MRWRPGRGVVVHRRQTLCGAKAYKAARGKGGLVRATWDEAVEIVTACMSTRSGRGGPGPGRRASHRSLRCRWSRMLPVHVSSNLIGGSMLSASTTGTPTSRSPLRRCSATRPTSPESGDWWNAGYLIMRGANLPGDADPRRALDYRGAIPRPRRSSPGPPDYADNVKFADEWLPGASGHRRRHGDGDGARGP